MSSHNSGVECTTESTSTVAENDVLVSSLEVTTPASAIHDVWDNEQLRYQIASQWIQNWAKATIRLNDQYAESPNRKSIAQDITNQLFIPTTTSSTTMMPYWRDMIAMTWNIITFHGTTEIVNVMMSGVIPASSNWKLDCDNNDDNIPLYRKQIVVTKMPNHPTTTTNDDSSTTTTTTMIEYWATFETLIGRGRAHVRLVSSLSESTYNGDDDDDDNPIPHDDNEMDIVDSTKATSSSTTTTRVATWKAYTLLTTLQELHDRPWRTAPNYRPRGVQHGPILNRPYWHESKALDVAVGLNSLVTQQHSRSPEVPPTEKNISNKNQEQGRQSTTMKPSSELASQSDSSSSEEDQSDTTTTTPDMTTTYVAIIGGGQGGLSLAARLRLLDVPYIVLESGPQPGSSWRNRYPSLHLHDPVYYNHMPYIPFPITWPTFCPRDKIANWLQSYATSLDLNVQCNCKVFSATQCPNDQTWTLQVIRMDAPQEGAASTSGSSNGQQTREEQPLRFGIRCRHLVFATGNSSHPRLPSIRGQFRGLQLHSSQYKGGRAYLSRALRHAVVIGSNNSAFDICQDLWEQLSSKGAGGTLESITMIQRSPAMVISTDSVLRLGLGPLYAEDAKIHHEEADLVATTVPYHMAMTRWKQVTQRMMENDAELLQGLTKAGYHWDDGPHGAGIFAKSATEGGGFYINFGCAELITQGEVAVKYATVERFDSDAVIVKHIGDDGNEERLPADLIVYATGFGTMDQWVHTICGPDVAKAVGRTWGLGLGYKVAKDPGPWEGELRNMWKPTTVDGLWFQGGNLAQNRHYSRYLALQLAARYMGIEPKLYGIPKPTPGA